LDFLASRPARWRFLPDSLTSRSTGSPLPEGPPSSSVRIGLFPQASPQRLISLLHTITCMSSQGILSCCYFCTNMSDFAPYTSRDIPIQVGAKERSKTNSNWTWAHRTYLAPL
jgi:hypothetical protein